MGKGILEGKVALVFGAAGSLGSAVSKEFAIEGAQVFISGRTMSNIDQLAKAISTEGGDVHADVVDALDDGGVNEYMDRVAKQAGKVDVVFNTVAARADEYNNGRTALESTVEHFTIAQNMMKSQYITARAAARHMVKQHSGVIVFLTGGPAKAHIQGVTSIGAACGGIEALTRNMALDFSPSGVRVVCVRSSAMMDSRTIQETLPRMSKAMGVPVEQLQQTIANLTMLKRGASTFDTAKVVAFAASDNARMMTGTVLNSTGGAAAD